MKKTLLIFCLFVAACSPASVPMQQTTRMGVAAPTVYDREAFIELVGKNKDVVLVILGPPKKTHESNGVTDYWLYEYRSRDSVTGKVDVMTWIYFDESGKVRKVSF